MFRHIRSASAPELYERSSHAAQTNNEDFETVSSHINFSVDEYMRPAPFPSIGPVRRCIIRVHKPSRLTFLAYVYVLLGCQVFLSTIQWLFFTYRWRPLLSGIQRSLYSLLLLLSWMNLTLGFLGFRRLQISYPLNWIVFVCMFESFTLLVVCLCLNELDLAWYFLVVSLAVLLLYTPLGLWFPSQLTTKLWILIFASLTIIISGTVALLTSLSMLYYIPLTFCLMFFGPWTMYNTFNLHAASLDNYLRTKYLEHAAKMYITYGCTVCALVLGSRFANKLIERENCKGVVFCQRNSESIVFSGNS